MEARSKKNKKSRKSEDGSQKIEVKKTIKTKNNEHIQ